MALERILPPTRAVFAAPFVATSSGAESLLVRVWCGRFGGAPATPEAVDVAYRFISRDGASQLSIIGVAPTTDRVVSTRTVALGDGLLQDLTVQWAGSSPLSGLCYVAVYLVRGLPPGATRIVAQLVGGYVLPGQGLVWPGSLVYGSLDGTGFQHLVTGAAPAAGAEATVVQPAGTIWRPTSINATFVTDATAIGRTPSLVVKESGGATIARVSNGSAGATTTVFETWAASVAASAAAGVNVQSLPGGLLLRAGASLTTATDNRQPGDQWSALNAYVEEWLEATV